MRTSVVVHMAEQHATAFVRVGFFAVAAKGVIVFSAESST